MPITVNSVIDGAARIRCEFCGQRYEFDPAAVEALFDGREAARPAPERVQ